MCKMHYATSVAKEKDAFPVSVKQNTCSKKFRKLERLFWWVNPHRQLSCLLTPLQWEWGRELEGYKSENSWLSKRLFNR